MWKDISNIDRHHLDRFLNSKGISDDDICSAVQAEIGLNEGEVLYLSGSVIEGFATVASDLDVFLITERTLSDFTQPIIIECKGVILDIEVLSRRQVCDIANAIRQPVSDSRKTLQFSLVQLQQLHRLIVGVPLTCYELFKKLQTSIDRHCLANILLNRAIANLNANHFDLVGFVEEADEYGMLFTAHKLLGYTVDILIAATGDTNPSDKWRSKKLSHLNHDQVFFPNGDSLGKLREILIEMTALRPCYSSDTKSFVRNCVRLSNWIVPRAQQRLLNINPYFENSDCTTIANNKHVGSLLPITQADVQVRYQQGELCLVKLNSNLIATINDYFHAALFFFDGITSVQGLTKYLRHLGCSPDEEIESLVRSMRGTLRYLNIIDV